jgi:hypothetical protein
MSVKSFFGIDEPDIAFQVDVPAEMRQGMIGGSIEPRISRSEALQVPAVLRARNLIAGTLARLPVHVRDKKREIVSATSLLDQIDRDVPNVVVFANTYEDLLFEGISWWRVTERNFQGFPTYCEHVGTSRVMIVGWSPPVNGVGPTGGKVYIDGRPIPDEDVIRFDSPNPPLLVHAARAIRTCLVLDTAASNYAKDPVPLGYFTPKEGLRPKEDDAAIQTLLNKWQQAVRRKVWGYIGAAWELKTLQFNAEQIQLAEQRQHAVLEIARAAGVDPEDLGVSTTSRTYQNSEQRRQDLIDFTMAHYMAAVEQRLSMNDVLPRGYEAKVNLDGFLRADTKTRYEAHKIALDSGFETVEEVRELEDRPNIRQNTAVPTPVPSVLPQEEMV